MFKERIKKAIEELKKNEITSLIVSNPTNIFYLSGFQSLVPTERESLGLLTEKGFILFVPEMYQEEGKAAREKSEIELFVSNERNHLFKSLADRLVEKAGFESQNLKYSEFEFIEKESKKKLIPTKGIIENLRISKDETELELIKKAVEITDQTFASLIQQIRAGMTEKQVAKMIAELMESFGADGMAFDPIVASGEGSALPHYRTSNKKIEKGILLIDMGAKFEGYNGDLTRTIYIGEPTKEFTDRYAKVLKAEEASIEAVKAGMTEEETWAVAMEELGDDGKFFIHGLGHGVGLDVHEAPYLRKDMKEKIQSDSLITIEPGIYFPGWGGIRIEDYCLITENGAEVLSKATKAIVAIQ